jgi:hypothetical protein
MRPAKSHGDSGLKSSVVKSSAEKTSPNSVEPATPLKPHRGLLMLFNFLLALWIAMMCVMYIGVYQQRHPRQSPVSSVPVAPNPAR